MPRIDLTPARGSAATLAVLAAALVGGCAGSNSESGRPAGATPAPEATATAPPFSCPVTIPPQPGFSPPAPYPRAPVGVGAVWYGTERLWTALDADGSRQRAKSVWWSTAFLGGRREPEPEIAVSWRRLDVYAPSIVDPAPGTNAFTTEEGWWMIAGLDPDEPGCWEVTASYRGSQLSYVYLQP